MKFLQIRIGAQQRQIGEALFHGRLQRRESFSHVCFILSCTSTPFHIQQTDPHQSRSPSETSPKPARISPARAATLPASTTPAAVRVFLSFPESCSYNFLADRSQSFATHAAFASSPSDPSASAAQSAPPFSPAVIHAAADTPDMPLPVTQNPNTSAKITPSRILIVFLRTQLPRGNLGGVRRCFFQRKAVRAGNSN